jgi:hypothetical protein
MIRNFLLLVLITAVAPIYAQKNVYKGFPSLVWPKLYDISFKKAKDNKGEYDVPLFSEAAKSLNNKVISLPGYMVPFENGVKSDHFMLSSLPLNACFFCGVGGPETVIEVFLTKEVTYSEKAIEVRGTLYLNDGDPDQMIYILKDAEITGAPGL